MKKEIVDNKTIELYLTKLIATFGTSTTIPEKILLEQYRNRNYAKCVSLMKSHMGLDNMIKLTCYADSKYPDPGSGARILFPVPLRARIGTMAFRNLLVKAEVSERVRNNFHTFIAVMAHELSHLVLHGHDHELKHSEVATDLCVLVFGFSEFASKGHYFSTYSNGVYQRFEGGYLSEEQLKHAILHLNYLKTKPTQQKPVWQKPEPRKEAPPKSIFERLFNLFE